LDANCGEEICRAAVVGAVMLYFRAVVGAVVLYFRAVVGDEYFLMSQK
jgi:hypothetical protein